MGKTLDAKEVARHNTASCCWLIVYKKVWRHTRDPHLRRARRDNRVDRPSAPTRGVRRASLASRMHGDVDLSTLALAGPVMLAGKARGGGGTLRKAPGVLPLCQRRPDDENCQQPHVPLRPSPPARLRRREGHRHHFRPSAGRGFPFRFSGH